MTAEERDFETLEEFKNWIISPDGPGILGYVPIQKFFSSREGLSSIAVYRRGKFQGELVIGHEGLRYTVVASEEVERCAVYIGGNVFYTMGEWAGRQSEEEALEGLNAEKEVLTEVPSPERGMTLAIPKGQDVILSFAGQGGIFLLLEKRDHGEHTSCLNAIVPHT